MTRAERDAAKARCEAATEGPWTRFDGASADTPEGHYCRYAARPNYGEAVLYAYGSHRGADLEFAGYARADLPTALAELDRLEALLRANGIDPEAR